MASGDHVLTPKEAERINKDRTLSRGTVGAGRTLEHQARDATWAPPANYINRSTTGASKAGNVKEYHKGFSRARAYSADGNSQMAGIFYRSEAGERLAQAAGKVMDPGHQDAYDSADADATYHETISANKMAAHKAQQAAIEKRVAEEDAQFAPAAPAPPAAYVPTKADLREERRAQQAVEDALGKTAAPKPSKHKLKKAAKERDRHKRQTRKRAAANQKFSAFDDSGSGSGKAGSGKANGDAAASSREPIGFGDLLPPPRNRAQHGQAGPRNAPAPPSRHQLTAANLAALNGNMDGGAPRNNRSISDSSGSDDSFHTAHSHHSRGRSGSASSISSGDRFHTPRGRSPSVSSDGGSIGSHHSPPAGRPNIRGSSDPKP